MDNKPVLSLKKRPIIVWLCHLYWFIPLTVWQTLWFYEFFGFIKIHILFFFAVLPAMWLAWKGNKRIQRILAVRANEKLLSDYRDPVLYLRSFEEDPITDKMARINRTQWDPRTEEQHLSAALDQLGPCVAIGLPGEELPELGVARMYVSDDQWQSTINDLMIKAQAVVFRAAIRPGFGKGLMWEVERATKLVKPERLLLIVTRDQEKYEAFRKVAERFFPGPLPEYRPPESVSGTMAGIIYFRPDWSAQLLGIRYGSVYVKMIIAARLQVALRPFFEQLGIPWNRPAFGLLNTNASFMVIIIVLFLVCMAVTAPFVLW